MRFCTSCQCDREEAGGVYKHLNKTARWVCLACIERRSPSIYRNVSGRNTKPEDVKRAFRGIYGQT
jgi:hypothetical protein